jgi:hypothetical protein
MLWTKQNKILFLFAVVFLLSACQSANISTTSSVGTPSVTKEAPLVVPTPESTTGVVIGQLISSKDGKPIDVTIYLAKDLTFDKPDLAPLVSLKPASNPRGVIDPVTGNFYFRGVEPGTGYVLSLVPMTGMEWVKSPGTTKPLIITVEAGKTLDLGIIKHP